MPLAVLAAASLLLLRSIQSQKNKEPKCCDFTSYNNMILIPLNIHLHCMADRARALHTRLYGCKQEASHNDVRDVGGDGAACDHIHQPCHVNFVMSMKKTNERRHKLIYLYI